MRYMESAAVIIGIFGGSFDPPHICHVLVCQYVLAMTPVEKVLVVPAYHHPFDKPSTPYADRVAMCRLAMSTLAPYVEISEIESTREGHSYTIDTVRELQRLYPRDEFRLIIGSDILHETERWKDFEDLRQLAPPIVVPRGEKNEPSFSFPNLSSTSIRQALREGRDVSEAVPQQVLAYIQSNSLYKP